MHGHRQRSASRPLGDHYTKYYRGIILFLILILIIFLMGFILMPANLSAWVPYNLHSKLLADYSTDLYPGSIHRVDMSMIIDAIRDKGTPVAIGYISELQSTLQFSVPTVTPVPTTLQPPGFEVTSTEDTRRSTPTQNSTGVPMTTRTLVGSQTPGGTALHTLTRTPRFTPIPTTPVPNVTILPGSSTPTASGITVTPFISPTRTPTSIYTPTRTSTIFPTQTPRNSPTPTYTRTSTSTPISTSTRTPVPTPTRTATRTRPPPTRTPIPYPEPDTPTPDPYP